MRYSTTPQSKQTFQALWRLEKIILDTLKFDEVVQKIVDSTVLELGYLQLGYEIVVLCLIDEKDQTLKRISVSQTKRAAEALAQLQDLKVPFKNIIIPLAETENLLIKSLNEKESFVTTNWHDILRPVFTPEESQDIQQRLAIKNSLIFPVFSSSKAIGVIIFSMSKDESQMGEDEMDLIRSFTDIVGLAVQNAAIYTSLEQTKVQLEKANEDLKALDKLKDEFLSMASHELKSPMNAIKNYLWLALKKGKDDPKRMDEFLNTAYGATQRLIALVNDLLDVSRIESGRITLNIQPIDLTPLLAETVAIFAPQAAEKGLQLVSQVPEHTSVQADDQKLREVFNNFISNAVKYTPKGSVTISATPVDGMVKVAVTDTGMGISEIDKQKLFLKFSRVNASYKELATIEGTGLGLWIAKQFIEKMGGQIGVDSEVGKGSTFWFTLPQVVAVATQPITNTTLQAPPSPSASPTV